MEPEKGTFCVIKARNQSNKNLRHIRVPLYAKFCELNALHRGLFEAILYEPKSKISDFDLLN